MGFPEPLLRAAPTTSLATQSDSAAQSPSARMSESVRPRVQVLKHAVDEAVRATNGNLSEAARRLHMARSTLYRILRS